MGDFSVACFGLLPSCMLKTVLPIVAQSFSTGPASASAVNCREFVHPTGTTQAACANLKQSDFVGGPVGLAFVIWVFSRLNHADLGALGS